MVKQTELEKKRAYDREWKRKERIRDIEKVRARARNSYRKMRSIPDKVEKRKAYMRKYLKKWRKDNEYQRRKHREWMREWYKKNSKTLYRKRRERPYEKLAATIRSRINDLVKRNYGSAKTEKLLGCSMKELKIYLEKQFCFGMTWTNYGFYGWHVDHIKPLSSFNLQDEKERIKAFHYTNLQPLWATENMKKGAKML